MRVLHKPEKKVKQKKPPVPAWFYPKGTVVRYKGVNWEVYRYYDWESRTWRQAHDQSRDLSKFRY